MLLVTGIAGHTGTYFLERLVKEKYSKRFRCVIHSETKRALLEQCGLDIDVRIGDIADSRFLADIMHNVDTILHIVNIRFSPRIVQTAIEKGVKRVVLVHTTGRYSKYKSASAEYIKIEDALLTLKDKIDITVLRPTMIYGEGGDRNMSKLINFMARFPVYPIFGNGKNLMQPVHARDLGNAYYDVLTAREATIGKEYNLSGHHAITYENLIRFVAKALNKKVLIIKVPFAFALGVVRLYNFLLRSKAIISVEQVLRLQEDKDFTHEEATKDFSYNPVSFEEGILGEIKEYLMNKNK